MRSVHLHAGKFLQCGSEDDGVEGVESEAGGWKVRRGGGWGWGRFE